MASGSGSGGSSGRIFHSMRIGQRTGGGEVEDSNSGEIGSPLDTRHEELFRNDARRAYRGGFPLSRISTESASPDARKRLLHAVPGRAELSYRSVATLGGGRRMRGSAHDPAVLLADSFQVFSRASIGGPFPIPPIALPGAEIKVSRAHKSIT
jgi:hypothetical protein